MIASTLFAFQLYFPFLPLRINLPSRVSSRRRQYALVASTLIFLQTVGRSKEPGRLSTSSRALSFFSSLFDFLSLLSVVATGETDHLLQRLALQWSKAGVKSGVDARQPWIGNVSIGRVPPLRQGRFHPDLRRWQSRCSTAAPRRDLALNRQGERSLHVGFAPPITVREPPRLRPPKRSLAPS